MRAVVDDRQTMGAPRAEAPPVIALEEVRLGYGDRELIQGLTLAVTPGQVFGLVGPSGGGKTTLLRAVLGLVRPRAGEVLVFGEPALTLPRRLRRRLGYVPQQFTLYPNLTVVENLRFVGGLYGLGWWRQRRRIRATLEALELYEHRGKLARHLSGGMLRRLQLAAALLHEPELLLVDEPTAGIDPILRQRCWEEFRALARQGRTVFFTTQYVNEAELCDQVALVAGGRLLAMGTPEALRRRAYGGDLVEVAGPALDLRAALALSRLPVVLRVESAVPGAVRVVVEDAARATPLLVRALEEQGVRVAEAATSQPSFDDVFTRLVQQHA
ncbi:MAG: ABC transporter ATP-binding protein [Chloroflexi bacterium]|nr:ABC transporter ATP-binding protein [Chloroflexota bacterium]